MAITLNGSTGIVEANIADSAITTNKIASGAVSSTDLAVGAARANFGAGAVLQIVQSFLSSPVAISSRHTSGGATAMSASITPSLASNKILILASLNIGIQYGSCAVRILRGSTPIALGDSAGSRYRSWWTEDGNGSDDLYSNSNVALNYLDSPNTLSQVTYNINLSNWNATTLYMNRTINDRDNADGYDNRTASSIILMEIAA
jgi:hypothetical protein